MFTATLSDNVKNQLDENQIDFLEKATNRVLYIDDELDKVTSPEVKFFYIKELMILFGEMHKIEFKRNYPNGEPLESTEIVMKDLIEAVSFFRNVFSHFPLYKTWDEIWISKSYAKSLQSTYNKKQKNFGAIVKFLEKCENKISRTFRITLKGVDEPRVFTLVYPKNLNEDTKVYFKDMIAEDEILIWLLNLMLEAY